MPSCAFLRNPNACLMLKDLVVFILGQRGIAHISSLTVPLQKQKYLFSLSVRDEGDGCKG